MGQLIQPRRRQRQQPRGPVEIDWSHPLSEGLLFYSIGMQDLVSGAVATPVSAWSASLSGINHGVDGMAMESHSITDGGFEYAGTDIQSLNNIKFFTAAIIVSFDSVAASSMGVNCPFSKTAWVGPWNVVAFSRSGSSTRAQISFNDGGTFRKATSDVDYLIFDGTTHLMSATKNETTTARYYRDGEFFSSVTASNFIHPIITVSDQSNIYTLSRNKTADGSGTNGRMFLAAMWRRELNADDHALLYANPWAMLRPRTPTLYYTASAAPGPLNLDRISSMHFQRFYEPIAMGA